MAKVLLGDVVDHIKDKVDKDSTDLEYYVGGEHIDGDEIKICSPAGAERSYRCAKGAHEKNI